MRKSDHGPQQVRITGEIGRASINMLEQETRESDLWEVHSIDEFGCVVSLFEPNVKLLPTLQLNRAVLLVRDFQMVLARAVADRERVIAEPAPIEDVTYFGAVRVQMGRWTKRRDVPFEPLR
jgi:hypothetical protein